MKCLAPIYTNPEARRRWDHLPVAKQSAGLGPTPRSTARLRPLMDPRRRAANPHGSGTDLGASFRCTSSAHVLRAEQASSIPLQSACAETTSKPTKSRRNVTSMAGLPGMQGANGLQAIAALVVGIVSIFFNLYLLVSVIAIVLGIIAMVGARRAGNQRTYRLIAILGIVVGMIERCAGYRQQYHQRVAVASDGTTTGSFGLQRVTARGGGSRSLSEGARRLSPEARQLRGSSRFATQRPPCRRSFVVLAGLCCGGTSGAVSCRRGSASKTYTISSTTRPTPGAKPQLRETSVNPHFSSTRRDAPLCTATRARRGRAGSRESSSCRASVATPRPQACRAIQ